MTEHDHREHVAGCFRCEISADEVTPDQEPRPDCTCGAYWDGDLSVPHSAGCAMGVRERAARNVLEQKAILDLLAETDGPDQEPRTGGVRAWHTSYMAGSHLCHEWYAVRVYDTEPGTWFPLAEAEALQKEATLGRLLAEKAGIGLKRPPEAVFEYYRRQHGIDQAEALIDPNDPAVRERLWASLYVIAASSYSDGIDSSSPTNAEMDEIVADVLDALRGKP